METVDQSDHSQLARMVGALIVLFVLICTLAGCSRSDSPSGEPLSSSGTVPPADSIDGSTAGAAADSIVEPLEGMKRAAKRGDWKGADALLKAVLIQHPADASALQLAARIAFQNGRQDQAATLMTEAVELSGYSDDSLVQQAVVALISTGRLMEGIGLLKNVVAKRPDDSSARRLLFDLSMGVDDRANAIPHGQQLVRLRKFDVELLTLLDNGNRRKEENRSYQQMVDRYPDDRRPLTGKARTALDRGDLELALSTASEILETFPEWIPARMIQGRALVHLNQPIRLAEWFAGSTTEEEVNAWHWIIRGDAALKAARTDAAVGAYLQAVRCDPELLQGWERMGKAIEEALLKRPRKAFPEMSQIATQIDLLSRLRQAKEDFLFAGQSSPARAVAVSVVLEDLGRLWEAEAWAAVALTLPVDGTAAKEHRDRLVRRLRKTTPWSVSKNETLIAELQSTFPVPAKAEWESLFAGAQSDRKEPPDARRFDFAVTPSLQDVAIKKGLDFFGKTTDRNDQPGLLLYASAGCGIGAIDFDLDGWPDVHCANAGGSPMGRDSDSNAMFRNVAGRFVDVTKSTATGDVGFGQGVAVGDVNEDGFPDLWIANYGPNRMLINNGDGTFKDSTDQWLGDTRPLWTTSSAIVDLNADGISDLWEVNYCAGMEASHKECQGKPEGPPSSVCAPIAFPAELDRVFFGTESGGFDDRTNESCQTPSVPGRGLGIVAGRIDADDQVDVFVTNDMTNNHFWVNGTGDTPRFRDAGVLRGLATDGRSQPQGSMGIAVGDFDHDQEVDLYVTNFAAENNTLNLQSRTSGIWNDETDAYQLSAPTIPLVGFGTQAIDLDNDSNLELFVSNGHIDPILDYAQPVFIFRFADATKFGLLESKGFDGYVGQEHVGRAVASLDYNRNGQLDLLVTHQTEPIALLENQTIPQNHWIQFYIVGKQVARDAVGAQVTVRMDGIELHTSKTSGSGYMASNQSVLHVGLRNQGEPVEVTVDWLNGSTQTYRALDVDQEWLLIQGEDAFSYRQDAL